MGKQNRASDTAQVVGSDLGTVGAHHPFDVTGASGPAWIGHRSREVSGYVRLIDVDDLLPEERDVLAVNQAFYDAFEARDLDAMSDIWEHTPRAVCIHPGWASLRGWGSIVSSFAALFRSSQSLQFLLTEGEVAVNGDSAWVTVDENLLGDQGGTTVAAVNIFVRHHTGGWRMVLHQGSAVHAARP
ncbi:MAG: hypothetical protein NVS3B21_08490 [Acidimicrobiales bacterium]